MHIGIKLGLVAGGSSEDPNLFNGLVLDSPAVAAASEAVTLSASGQKAGEIWEWKAVNTCRYTFYYTCKKIGSPNLQLMDVMATKYGLIRGYS